MGHQSDWTGAVMGRGNQGPLLATGILCTLLACAAGACSSTESLGNGFGESSSGGSSGSVLGGSSSSGDPSLQGCATANADAKFSPVNLIMLFDRSGSMVSMTPDTPFCTKGGRPACPTGSTCVYNEGYAQDPEGICGELFDTKWVPARDAALSFLGDPASAGIHVLFDFFPKVSLFDVCETGAYFKPQSINPGSPYGKVYPVLPLTPLPNANAFRDLFANYMAEGPTTPMLVALQAGYIEGKRLRKENGHPSAVLLVTDGVPRHCDDKMPGDPMVPVKAAAAGAVQDDIRTFVLGVGQDLVQLHAIAQSGGTTQAILADLASPAQVKDGLLRGFDSVRQSIVPCEFVIPSPPEGQTLDPKAVNVTVEGKLVKYDATCAGNAGWQYDDPKAPTKVKLCSATCESARKSSSAKVVFGCQTVLK